VGKVTKKEGQPVRESEESKRGGKGSGYGQAQKGVGYAAVAKAVMNPPGSWEGPAY